MTPERKKETFWTLENLEFATVEQAGEANACLEKLKTYITHLEKYQQHLPECFKWEDAPNGYYMERVLHPHKICTCGLEGGSQ